MNINKDEYNRLQAFQNNMKSKFGNHALLHNIYQIKTEDMNGNVNEFYGMNIMTNYFFATVYGNRGEFDRKYTSIYPSIYIGNGIDISHQPSITNNSMFNNFTTSILSNTCHKDDCGGVYHSDAGYYVKTMLIHQSVYDYNINQITSNFTANEVGWGTGPTTLFSHSKIYDINGNETTFTKRINEKTTITLYLTMACHYSFFESLWSNGSYGAIDIKHLFGMNDYRNNQAWFNHTPELCKSLHRSYTMEAGYSSNNPNLGHSIIRPYYYEQPSDYDGYHVNFTVTYDETNHTGTYETNNVVTYLMDSKYHQFANFVIDSLYYYQYGERRPPEDAYILRDTDFLFVKPYKTPTKESVTTFIKTDWWNRNYLYDVLGFNRYANERYGYGFLPVLDMDIKSVYRYNYLTDDYDIAETFTNKPDNDYNMFNWMYCCREYIVYPDGVARNAYIYCNPHYNDRAVLGFDEGGYTMYCTDTWWDVSTWKLVENTLTLAESQRNKKYYILDRFLYGSSGYEKQTSWLYENERDDQRRFLKPRIFTDSDKSAIDYEFTPYKHATYTNDETGEMRSSSTGISVVPFIVDDTHDLFVLNNHIIHKVSERIDVNTVRYMYENPSTVLTPNFETIVTPGWTFDDWACLAVPFYTENSQQIFMVTNHSEKYGNQSRNINENHPIFFMADMTLSANDIGPGIEFINISSFTEATANNTLSNYAALSVGKYLCFAGSTSSGSEVVIYDTENHTETLLPFKIHGWRRLYGTNCLIFDPSNDLEHWTIYDVPTQTITHEFDIPNDYVSQTMFMGFDEFVYILCKIGNDYSLLLHDIAKDTTQQMIYPSTWFIDGQYSWNMSIPYGFNGGGNIEFSTSDSSFYFNPYNTATLSSVYYIHGTMSSMDHVYQRVSYKDGILVTSNTYDLNHIFIFTHNDAANIITQSLYNTDNNNQRYKCPYIVNSHSNYWLFLSMASSSRDNSNYSASQTIIVNLGKIVNNHGPITISTIDSDYYLIMFNRIYRDNYVDGDYATRLFIPFNDRIYYVNGSTHDIYVYPYTTFIEHKITFETGTCTPINNPKLITLPNLSITMSNVAPV